VPCAVLSNGGGVWFPDRDVDAHACKIATLYAHDGLETTPAVRSLRRPLDRVDIDT